MEMWICLLILGFIIIMIALMTKIYFLKKSAKEIKTAFEEKVENETNTLISISSHDRDMRTLATTINSQLQSFNQSRQKYQYGDLELKEAVMNISHDLRTPLTAIYGYLKLLKDEECSDVTREYLSSIENRTIAMKQLTDELFHYSIVMSETEDLNKKNIVINRILEESISSYYAVFKEKNIIPHINIPDIKIVRCLNENALSRIFSNIISNAIKYSDGDFSIILTEKGEITFSNHAPCLTDIQVGRLFDRFYTVNEARKSTGLGLSIAKILTEQMGGTIMAAYKNESLSICLSFLQN